MVRARRSCGSTLARERPRAHLPLDLPPDLPFGGFLDPDRADLAGDLPLDLPFDLPFAVLAVLAARERPRSGAYGGMEHDRTL